MALNGAKRLADSLFGKAEMPDLGLGDTGKVLPLRPMMERLLSLDREAWGFTPGRESRWRANLTGSRSSSTRERRKPAGEKKRRWQRQKPYWKCRTVWQNPQRPP
ncbi:hypothetical protein DW841_26250 [Hungatella hathewayi]|nr:hypothetical protein DW841_26250 [Hungatella hathewayi]